MAGGGYSAPSAPAARAPRGRAPRMPKMTVPKARAPRAPRPSVPRPAATGVATNPLYDPSVMLAGQPLLDAATAMADTTYQPQIASLQRQQGSNVAQGTRLQGNVSDYYRQLAQQEATGLTRETAIGQLLQQQQGGVGQAAQGAFGQMSADEAARQAADQAVRGGGLGGAGGDQVAAAITGGQARSAQLQQAAQNSSSEQAANWENLANANLLARQVHGGEVTGQIATSTANTNKSLQGKLADLQASRASEITKDAVGLRQQGFTNAATLSGLGIKQADLAANLQKSNQVNATANRRISASEKIASANRSAAGQRQQAALGAADQRAAAKAQSQQDAAAQKAAQAQAKHVQQVRTASGKQWAAVENALGLMGTIHMNANPKTGEIIPTLAPTGPVANTDQTAAYLRSHKTPEWALRAALDIRHQGFISPQTVAMIHSAAPDIRIPNRYRPPQAGRLANFPT